MRVALVRWNNVVTVNDGILRLFAQINMELINQFPEPERLLRYDFDAILHFMPFLQLTDKLLGRFGQRICQLVQYLEKYLE